MGLDNYPKRGEIYLVSLDPTLGSEISKTRPALVISNNINNQYSDTITVIPITSFIKKIYPFESELPLGEGGLAKKSKTKCNQIRAIDKIRLVKSSMHEVEKAILIHLGMYLETI